MIKPKQQKRQPLLTVLAVGIVIIGIACAWWFMQRGTTASEHPEAALFRALAEPRVPLAGAFRSYDAEAAITAQLNAAGLGVRRSVLQRPPSTRYPPRAMVTLTVEAYPHLGSAGTMVLEFFNDRLMEADFRPDEPSRYTTRLHREYPALRRDRTGHAEWQAPPLRIWSTVDLARSKVGRTLGSDGVVLWQDTRLIAQRDDWDARYGHIPVPAPK